jgi:hypothetical protein
MKISHELKDAAEKGMADKAAEFAEKGHEIYLKSDAAE